MAESSALRSWPELTASASGGLLGKDAGDGVSGVTGLVGGGGGGGTGDDGDEGDGGGTELASFPALMTPLLPTK